jgi:hypothetical protein
VIFHGYVKQPDGNTVDGSFANRHGDLSPTTTVGLSAVKKGWKSPHITVRYSSNEVTHRVSLDFQAMFLIQDLIPCCVTVSRAQYGPTRR